MDDLQSILDTLSKVVNSGDKMPEVDLVQVMDEIWSLLQEDASALGITSGKYVALRGDPRGLDDKDVLKAVRSHVPKETYKELGWKLNEPVEVCIAEIPHVDENDNVLIMNEVCIRRIKDLPILP